MFGRPIRWTTEDDRRIRTFVVEGASVTRVALALKRKRVAIMKRRETSVARSRQAPWHLIPLPTDS
jgi:hypothetical protein